MEDKEASEKRLGTTLKGKWTLDRLLGVGGMAAVYAATHKIGRKDAIKILHPEVARSKDLRARFDREAHAVNKFRHPGAVEIRDIDITEDGAPFLVMELLEGESLLDRAQRLGGIETGEMLRLADELLDVLAAAHAEGIIHRDIKLDNLFVQQDGRLKVLDFGIARMTDVKTAMRTKQGATLGTVSYMAPEQVRGIDMDHRADLFAVGATMFRLLAKRRVHEARTEPELLVKMATQAAPPLASVAPGVPQGICMLVDRALAFDRNHRYPDARTMQEDVRAIVAGELPPHAARLAQESPAASAAPVSVVQAPAAGAAPVAPTQADPAGEPTAAAVPPPSMSMPMPSASMPSASMAMPPPSMPAAASMSMPAAAGPAPPRRPSRGATAVVAAAGALLAIATAFALWWFLRDTDSASAELPTIQLPAEGSPGPAAPAPLGPAADTPAGKTAPGTIKVVPTAPAQSPRPAPASPASPRPTSPGPTSPGPASPAATSPRSPFPTPAIEPPGLPQPRPDKPPKKKKGRSDD